jgi:hypothetical protein
MIENLALLALLVLLGVILGWMGPYSRQAVRWIGRTLERFGAWLDMWSWGWR